jgi:hypothetical protein
MDRADHKMMFTAMAFLAVLQKGGKLSEQETAEQVKKLSDLIEAFCSEHVKAA